MKRALLFFAACAAIFGYFVATNALGQQNMNSSVLDRPTALAGVLGESDVQSFPSRAVGEFRGSRFGVDYAFNGTDGAAPTATLIEDAAGNLYGTTSSGGSGCGGSGCGVVFKLNTANKETVLHTFTGPDGATPYGHLLLDGSGNLYGTTSGGGSGSACQGGCGTVFKIDRSGVESVLHSFTGNPDGTNPRAGLVSDNSGNLYGTTENGGAFGFGTIFKIDAGGSETVLHSFAGGSTDGADPKAGLILDPDGNLYGTTFTGGSGGYGTVFELDTTNTETILYNFTGNSDGGNPFGGLTRDTNGVLYGTTENGGIYGTAENVRVDPLNRPYGCCKGVVYQLDGAGEKALYTFTGGNDGGTPAADLVLYNGVLYGTTLSGGPGHRGTAFSVTIANGSESVLHGFTGKTDGATPGAGLLINAAGVLYGTAEGGGRYQHGTVFQYKK